MDAGSDSSAGDEIPSPSNDPAPPAPEDPARRRQRNRYDEQKQRDWKTFLRFLENRKPRLTLSRVRSTHVIEFLTSIDSFGKTLIHEPGCPFFGRSDPHIIPCACPLRQSWGSLDALVGRLRRSCEEAPSRPETNPFGVRTVRNFLLRVKDEQATARGIPYSRKRKSRTDPAPDLPESSASVEPEASGAPPGDSAAAPAAVEGGFTALLGGSAIPADAMEAFMANAPPGVVLPFPGTVGQDVPPGQMQFCWVRPPVTDNESTPPFYPVWQYPTMQSMMPFLSPFPYMPPGMPMPMPMPKQEDQTDDDPSAAPSGTVDEGQSSSNEDGDSDSVQASPNHTPDCSWQRKRYLQQKGRDWNTFMRYLENRQPKLTLSKVRSTHVLEFLKSIEQVGKTLVHESGCPYFGNPNPPAPCACPLRQSWGSLDAMVGRLRSTCEENPNRPATNPFGVRPVRNFLLQIKDIQATARGIPYSRKRKPKLSSADTVPPQAPVGEVVGNGAESTVAIREVVGNGAESSVATAATVISFTSLLREDSAEQGGNSSAYQEDFSAATAYFADSGATSLSN